MGTLNATDLSNIKNMLSNLLDEKLDPKIEAITQRLEKAEQYLDKSKRTRNMIIFGLVEQADEVAEGQVLVVDNLFQTMGVSGVLVDDIHRVGPKGSRTRPLLVKLVRSYDKKRIFAGKGIKIERKENIHQ